MSNETAQILFQGINLILILYLTFRVEKIKAGISKDLEIHCVQFGREFHVYRYLWEKIAHLKRALNAYTDPLNQKTEEELKTNLLKQYFEVNETALNNEPFIKMDIYEHCKTLLDEANIQVRYVQNHVVLEEGMNTNFERLVETVKTSIRKYIRNETEAKKPWYLFFKK